MSYHAHALAHSTWTTTTPNALSISLSRLRAGRTYKYPTQRTVHLARMPSHVNTMHGVEPYRLRRIRLPPSQNRCASQAPPSPGDNPPLLPNHTHHRPSPAPNHNGDSGGAGTSASAPSPCGLPFNQLPSYTAPLPYSHLVRVRVGAFVKARVGVGAGERARAKGQRRGRGRG